MIQYWLDDRHFVSEKQEAFLDSQMWVRGFVAGRGSGKTVVGALHIRSRATADESWMSVWPSYGMVHETPPTTFSDVAWAAAKFIRPRSGSGRN